MSSPQLVPLLGSFCTETCGDGPSDGWYYDLANGYQPCEQVLVTYDENGLPLAK